MPGSAARRVPSISELKAELENTIADIADHAAMSDNAQRRYGYLCVLSGLSVALFQWYMLDGDFSARWQGTSDEWAQHLYGVTADQVRQQAYQQ